VPPSRFSHLVSQKQRKTAKGQRGDPAPQHRIHPYLLRRLAIDRPNATMQIVRLHHLGRIKDSPSDQSGDFRREFGREIKNNAPERG
jgi:hypothetical protein